MSAADAAYAEGQVAADLMLREPKALPGAASVADVREALADPHVQMVLLADGRAFRGAITEVPDDAPGEAPALGFVDPAPETIAPDEPAATAYARTAQNSHRRLIVLDEGENLLGLLCLNESKTRFCRSAAEDGGDPA